MATVSCRRQVICPIIALSGTTQGPASSFVTCGAVIDIGSLVTTSCKLVVVWKEAIGELPLIIITIERAEPSGLWGVVIVAEVWLLLFLDAGHP